ncbi:parasitic phase-specific protein PSP-1 [Aureobasidium subglaciale]|nr:parasitic phase-specific protein PSP-1 [Aureobasidium subglaciale]
MSFSPDIFTRDTTRPAHCTKDTCPASYSIYGYAPNLGANAFFVALFAISCLVFCYQARLYRTWLGFSIAMILGTSLESIGFKLNIVLLTFAPAFLTAGIYLLLKQLTISLAPALSPLQPSLYTPIFVSCDIIAILLQGTGGAISAAAANGTSKKLLDLGVNVMIAGLSSQVITLAIFALLAAVFFVRVAQNEVMLSPSANHIWQDGGFRCFMLSAVAAFLFVFIRCAYRIAELKDGWGSAIMRREDEFIILDSVCFETSLKETSMDLSRLERKEEDEENLTVFVQSKAHT